MSRKNTLQFQILNQQSLAASFISPVSLVPRLDNISYQINVTTTNSTGTFTIQGSDDYEVDELKNVVNPGNWVTLPLGGATANPVAAAANDLIMIAMNQVPFNALRVVYTSTVAGTGHCDLWLMAKMIGG